MRSCVELLLTLYTSLFLVSQIHCSSLILAIPPTFPTFPALTTAHLDPLHNISSDGSFIRETRQTISSPVTAKNQFVFRASDLFPPSTPAADQPIQWSLMIASRDYEFARYTVTIKPSSIQSLTVDISRNAIPGASVRPANPSQTPLTLSLADEGDSTNQVTYAPPEPGLEQTYILHVLKQKQYFEERPKFSPLSLLKNPMVLIGILGLVFVMGVPKLIENMDPEMRAEFEEHQKGGLLATTGAAATGQNPIQNFDLAGWMAGRSTAAVEAARKEVASASAGGKGSGKKARH